MRRKILSYDYGSSYTYFAESQRSQHGSFDSRQIAV